MAGQLTRAVLVHRPTDYELLLQARATRGQAEFFLRSRGQEIGEVEREHETIHAVIERVLGRIPARWRRVQVTRAELNRFLFEPEDVVIAVGQDGLVANVAKYVNGQVVIGINPLPERFDGPLVRHRADAAADLFATVDAGRDLKIEERTMVEARLDDGQSLVALNEVFVGHRSHQSARYRIGVGGKEERQSSSGMVACTGTGATGWARSINGPLKTHVALPAPTDPAVCFFVREPWPSRATGTNIASGRCGASEAISVVSEMNQGGVVFGDGIEEDYLPFDWGRKAELRVSQRRLRLAV
jgi:NAD kinase